MKDSPYPRRSVNFGIGKVAVNDRFDPLLIRAITKYQDWHTKEFEFRPSRSGLFTTAVLQNNERIKDFYEDLVKKERTDGTKYLDGIKTKSRSVFNEDFSNI